ncbi:MAG: hypothetical protein JNL38_29820 [Myxococcales bacterium]|nr:hypothetical protein [Myxococcales bacterium]
MTILDAPASGFRAERNTPPPSLSITASSEKSASSAATSRVAIALAKRARAPPVRSAAAPRSKPACAAS